MSAEPIIFIATGGTIDKVYFDAKSEYEVGSPLIESILAEGNAIIDFEVVRLLQKDSLDLTDEDRDTIRTAALGRTENRIIITHGTDTMVQTARAIGEVTNKVIVLTGSLSPARFRESDAPFNIASALTAVQLLQPGVYIVMNGKVFNPARTKKDPEKNRFVEL